MLNPVLTSPGSIMPPYPWLLENELDTDLIPARIRALQTLGTPYPEGYDKIAVEEMKKQAAEIAEGLRKDGVKDDKLEDREIVALIAYLQRLGTDIKPKAQATK
jgi:cytochrome c oxidase cbb3-type subunit I/II